MLLIEEAGMSRPETMTIGALARSAGVGVELLALLVL
jgi:hypothetical protein